MRRPAESGKVPQSALRTGPAEPGAEGSGGIVKANFATLVQRYFARMAEVRSSGGATDELSYYGAIGLWRRGACDKLDEPGLDYKIFRGHTGRGPWQSSST